MTWDLDSEHLAFQKVCRTFVDQAVRQHSEGPGGPASAFPQQLWGEMAAAGLLGLAIPAQYGGSEGDALAITILAEELARADSGLAITPLVSSYMAAPHIVHFGSPTQRENWLPGLADGSVVAAIAVTEPGAGSDVAAIRTQARKIGLGWSLEGTKTFITNAGLSDVMVVAAKTDPTAGHRGISTFLIDPRATGVTLGPPMSKLGWRSSDTRDVALEEAVVLPSDLLGEQGAGFYQIMQCFQLERVVLAGMAVGLAQACLDELDAWIGQRQVFGSALRDLQVVRHRLAAMTVEVESARLLTYTAAARIDDSEATAARHVAMAKYYAAQVANRVADEAVQFFGGAGFMDETPVTRHFRDARILRIGGGTDEIQLEILAKQLTGTP